MPIVSSAMQTALEARVLRPVFIGFLDFENDPVRVWTGPGFFAPSGTGDALLDGEQFDHVGGLVNISDAVEDQGSGSPMTVTAAAADLDEPLLLQIVRDQRAWHMRKAVIWLGLLDEDEVTVIASPVRLKAGVIKELNVPAASGAQNSGLVTLTIDADFGDATGKALKVADHSTIWDGADTFGNYVQQLANRPAGLQGAHDVAQGTSSGVSIPDGFGRIQF